MKHSDNMTDLVEHFDRDDNKDQENPTNKDWEVKNDDGELIKLDEHDTSNEKNNL